jgi:lipopolysaccharide transport system ATP-binding protein
MKNDLIFDLSNVGVYYRRAASIPWKNNKFWALHDVSFNVRPGQTVGIIGRNGAGKSTLLKILAGIIKPDTGTIIRADVAVTMQSLGAGFDPRLTGRQNIVLNGLLLGMDRKQIRYRERDIIELADIGEFIDEPVKNYSSGMKARLGFSIAYHVDADVMLIDEVLAVGDQAFKEKSSELIRSKIKSDRTVILVTHSMEMVKELCDCVIQIEKGRSLPELPVDESIKRYMGTKLQS